MTNYLDYNYTFDTWLEAQDAQVFEMDDMLGKLRTLIADRFKGTEVIIYWHTPLEYDIHILGDYGVSLIIDAELDLRAYQAVNVYDTIDLYSLYTHTKNNIENLVLGGQTNGY